MIPTTPQGAGGPETPFTRLVGCRWPLQQAAMGSVATVDLAAAVADAGALGMLGTPMVPAAEAARLVENAAGRTSGVLGINFLMPFLDRDAVAVVSGRVRVVEFFYGDPDAGLVSLVHDGGSLAAWQVGSPDEARAATGAGCDLVIAQGAEAGGHVRGTLALFPLLEQVLGAVEVPVVAAGGIGTSRAVADVLSAGAAAVRVGTRFLAAEEADVHPKYLDALISAGADDTILTTTFDVMWPDAPHRVLASCVDAARSGKGEFVGETVLGTGARIPVPRFSPLPPVQATSGDIGSMALYAGQSVGAVLGCCPAKAIVEELTAAVGEIR